MILNFAFWNTALSPPRVKNDVPESDIIEASRIIMSMFLDKEIDFIALCEVNETSFTMLKNVLSKAELSSIYMGDKTETGSKFDLGVFYNPRKVEIQKGISHTGMVGTSSVKIAQHIAIKTPGTDDLLDFLISHWPSRLQHVSDSFRNECSIGMRNSVNQKIESGSQVVMMGDYNDDPYSHSLFKNLHAVNDRALVISKPKFWLYNPFWKTLFARVDFSKNISRHDFGTCYSQANNRNSWSSFDQMIFSGSFLADGPWYLREAHTGIVINDELLRLIMDKESVFDHLPIIGSIEREVPSNV